MSTYVLVHGAWHGAWCWQRVTPRLQAQGHTVLSPDLPGSGEDKTPIQDVTLKAYADRICAVIDGVPEPVVLVGHSLGGMVISQTAEYMPDKIKVLVYACAFLLKNGQSRFDAPIDPESFMSPDVMLRSEDGTYTTLKKKKLRPLFYNDCSETDLVEVRKRVGRQATAPGMTPLATTEEKFGRVPRVYIQALRDHGITPQMQRQMFSALPCREVLSIDTGHSPFWSRPKELANLLLKLGG